MGMVNQIVETLQTRHECFGISYVVVPVEHMDAFAPVVERLAGR